MSLGSPPVWASRSIARSLGAKIVSAVSHESM